ncbi:Leucine-rich repeat serine/threonine-protein kinase 2 [Irineochytrium annulatum]|nr:Leucine-rich repeat serine/threonine-protein kinase 2 [Irineochytrium annulatum]
MVLLDHHAIPEANVEVFHDQLLGRGGFGKVYRGRYRNGAVAVKEPRFLSLTKAGCALDHQSDGFREEITILASLRPHTNLVTFYGFVRETSAIVMELLELGSLKEYYRSNKMRPFADRINIALDVAEGMAFLHSRPKPIIHSDLKGANVLLTVQGTRLLAKVTDFGLAVAKDSMSQARPSAAIVGSQLYIDPAFYYEEIGRDALGDVFSYAVVLTELASWKGPYGFPEDNFPWDWFLRHMQRADHANHRPALDTFPKDVPAEFLEVIKSCWNPLRQNRPRFTGGGIADRLKKIQKVEPGVAVKVSRFFDTAVENSAPSSINTETDAAVQSGMKSDSTLSTLDRTDLNPAANSGISVDESGYFYTAVENTAPSLITADINVAGQSEAQSKSPLLAFNLNNLNPAANAAVSVDGSRSFYTAVGSSAKSLITTETNLARQSEAQSDSTLPDFNLIDSMEMHHLGYSVLLTKFYSPLLPNPRNVSSASSAALMEESSSVFAANETYAPLLITTETNQAGQSEAQPNSSLLDFKLVDSMDMDPLSGSVLWSESYSQLLPNPRDVSAASSAALLEESSSVFTADGTSAPLLVTTETNLAGQSEAQPNRSLPDFNLEDSLARNSLGSSILKAGSISRRLRNTRNHSTANSGDSPIYTASQQHITGPLSLTNPQSSLSTAAHMHAPSYAGPVSNSQGADHQPYWPPSTLTLSIPKTPSPLVEPIEFCLRTPRRLAPYASLRSTSDCAFTPGPGLPSFSILSNHALTLCTSTARFCAYYECQVLDADTARGTIAIGLATDAFPETTAPGWSPISVSFLSTGEVAYCTKAENAGTGNRTTFATVGYGTGDTIGCGYISAIGCVFFTLNGEFLGESFSLLGEEAAASAASRNLGTFVSDMPRLPFHAAIGAISGSVEFRMNFGAKPFLYMEAGGGDSSVESDAALAMMMTIINENGSSRGRARRSAGDTRPINRRQPLVPTSQASTAVESPRSNDVPHRGTFALYFRAFILTVRQGERCTAEQLYQSGVQCLSQKNYSGAKKAWEDAAAQSYPDAYYQLYVLYTMKVLPKFTFDEAIGYLRSAADLSHAASMVKLGSLLLAGEGVEKDIPKAIDLLWLAATTAKLVTAAGSDGRPERKPAPGEDEAANATNVKDIAILTPQQLYELGCKQADKKDYKAAISFFLEASKAGHAASTNQIGQFFERGNYFPKSAETALKHYTIAAKAGDVHAKANLASCYLRGYGVLKNVPEAVALYKQASDLRRAVAMVELGRLHEIGNGVSADPILAARLYDEAAKLGYVEAKYEIGMCYLNGFGVPKDVRLAIKWLFEAAAERNADAINELACCCFHGVGVPQDQARAASMFAEAAEAGCVEAKTNLASCHANGCGVPKDMKLALKLCEEAAGMGHARAYFNLGLYYDIGHGVAVDKYAAALSFAEAKRRGFEWKETKILEFGGEFKRKFKQDIKK